MGKKIPTKGGKDIKNIIPPEKFEKAQIFGYDPDENRMAMVNVQDIIDEAGGGGGGEGYPEMTTAEVNEMITKLGSL